MAHHADAEAEVRSELWPPAGLRPGSWSVTVESPNNATGRVRGSVGLIVLPPERAESVYVHPFTVARVPCTSCLIGTQSQGMQQEREADRFVEELHRVRRIGAPWLSELNQLRSSVRRPQRRCRPTHVKCAELSTTPRTSRWLSAS